MQNYQISRGNRYEEGLVFRWSVTSPQPNGRIPALPTFVVHFYLCVPPGLKGGPGRQVRRPGTL